MSEVQSSSKQRDRRRLVKVLAAEAIVAVVILVWALAGNRGSSSAEPDPTASGPAQSGSLVAGCSGIINPKTPVPSWSAAPAVDPADKRERWVLGTNCGEIAIRVYPNQAPLSVASMRFLSDQGYFDNTPCHRVTTQGLFVVQCGDPVGTGTNGPGYNLPEENLPTAGGVTYPRGTVALARSSQPNSSAAQFFIVYKDTTINPDYTIIGRVVEGIEIVEAVAAAGTLGMKPDGVPAQSFGILSSQFVKSGGN